MPRTGSILRAAAGAAAAALLASGCEYWRNLTQEIVPDQGVVTLIVRDALTGKPLTDASCGKRGQPAFLVDGNGVIERDDMPTGIYDLVCEAPKYRPREKSFELRLGQTRSDTIWLVRQGGDDWYQDDGVRIQPLKGNSRYPGTLMFEAYPFDSSGRFWYEWSSNLNDVPAERPTSVCTLYTPPSVLDTQTLHLGLKVWFKPKNDPQKYLIDSAFLPTKLVRNNPPEIRLNVNFMPNVKTGCSDDTIKVAYFAEDLDGDIGCQVRVTSTDPDKPAGLIDTLVPCGWKEFAFKVEPHLGAESTAVSMFSNLKFEVKDQNGERQSTNLKVETVSNIPPRIRMRLGPQTPYVFTTTQVLCTLEVDDPERGALENAILDWGNGNLTTRSLGFLRLPGMTIFNGEINDTGTFTIKARINDRCNGSAEVEREIEVRRNSMPVFTVVNSKGVDTSTGEYRLQVGVVDVDLDNNMDSVNLLVQWNKDGDQNDVNVYKVNANQPSGQILTHRYDPSSPESHFKIFLQAFDQNDNRKDTTITVPRAEAIWNPPPPSPSPDPAGH